MTTKDQERFVWIYKQSDLLKIFDTDDEARAWFEENDPEGVAFKHTRGPLLPAGSGSSLSEVSRRKATKSGHGDQDDRRPALDDGAWNKTRSKP